jgi:hypothetical protein
LTRIVIGSFRCSEIPRRSRSSTRNPAGFDDIWNEPTRKRIYITGGEGFVDVFQQLDPDHYTRIGHIPTAIGARTSIIWATRTRQGMTIAAPAYYPDGSAALLGAQFVDY